MLSTNPAPGPGSGPWTGPAGAGGQTNVRTRQARRRRRKVRGVVILTAVFLASMAALAWYLSARNDNSIVAAVETTEPPGLGVGDDPTKAGPGTEADTTDRSAPQTTARVLVKATTTEPAAPTTVASPTSSTTTATTATTATSRVRRPSTTAAPTSTTPPETSAPTTSPSSTDPPTTAAPTTTEPTTTSESTTTTLGTLTSGTPTPVGVQVDTPDGEPLAGVTLVFRPGSPASDGARLEKVVTNEAGFAELTLLSGCYSIDFDARHAGHLADQPALRRCFKPVGVQHLVAMTAEVVRRAPVSSCVVWQSQDPVGWFIRIVQDDGQWALAYRVITEGNHRVVLRDQAPIESNATSRTYALGDDFPRSEAVRVIAAHPSGSSVAVGCTMG
ncbi:MAG: hypothetical protein AAGA93_06515 [Actinomycetota bacterium]